MSILDDNSAQNMGNGAGLSVSAGMKRNWMTTSKWAMFFAILGFVYVGINLLSIGAVSSMMQMIATMSDNPMLEAILPLMSYFTIISVVGMIALFFVCFYHLKFSTNIQRAVNFTDQVAFENAWLNLRNHFRLYGILICVVIVLYIVMMVVAMSMLASHTEQLPME